MELPRHSLAAILVQQKKDLIIQLVLLPTTQKTDGTPRGEHREKVEQNVVQDFLMKKGPRLWQVVL